MGILANPEDAHTMLYSAHWAALDAGNKLHAVIVALHNAGRYSETRAKLAGAITDLERARELLNEALIVAGNGRSKLIHQTGCDGSCSDRADRAASQAQSPQSVTAKEG